MSNKRYAGKIENWYTQDFSEYKDKYGPSLGYVVHGRLGHDHKNRGFDYRPIRTSLVVAEEYAEDGKTLIRIHTLNSIYDLGERLVY